MIAIAGAHVVLADRVHRGGSVVIDAGRIAAIESRTIDSPGLDRVDHRGR
jgi:alpha-D-ribose 1-methylphosphonate 5-triphosphate diphosphatase PhnM